MRAKPTVTIGIPAYNEEANIGHLINDLLSQKPLKYDLQQIIVYCDGCTDKTVEVVRGIDNKKIKVINARVRKGVGHGQNRIFKRTDSEILVIIHADARISDPVFIEKLIKPVRNGKADLTSGRLLELPATSFFEKIIFTSMEFKRRYFEKYKQGNNVWTCHGLMRAFSKDLYKKMRFPQSVGEDMFSYLYCIYHGFKYKYVRGAALYYKLPDNYEDHKRQSVRFFHSKDNFYKIFSEDFVKRHTAQPLSCAIKSGLLTFLEKPSYMTLYVAVYFVSYIQALFDKEVSFEDAWLMASSSKMLRIEK